MRSGNCLLLASATALSACSGGFVADDDTEDGSGGSGGESAIVESARGIAPDEPPAFDDIELLSTATCVFPLNVTSTDDPPSASCGNPPNLQAGTLRHAIACANQHAGPDTITSTISGLVSLNSACGGLTISDSLTWQSTPSFIIGGASGMTGDLIHVNGAGITVNSGYLRLVGSSGRRGVRLSNGTLYLNYPYINNMLDPAGAVGAGHGAGILVWPTTGASPNLTLNKANLTNNRSTITGSRGGGLYFGGPGWLKIEGSLFEANAAALRGGGIAYAGANTPAAAQATITNTTVTHNTAGSFSSGISIENVSSPQLIVRNSTISENFMGAGAVGAETGGMALLDHTTIADNTKVGGGGSQAQSNGGSIYVTGSILRGSGPACGGVLGNILGAANVWHDATCGFVSGVPNANALLGPVQDNGGSCGGPSYACKTQKPAAGSPANNVSSACPSTDQRGAPRGGAPCWAGAYEL